jgi:hypothetical protein
MTEREWVKSIIPGIELLLRQTNDSIRVVDGHRLSYANEVLTYDNENKPREHNSMGFETDILILEQIDPATWKPRVVIETKLGSVTTHDAITYSQKAQTHKYVHPYLRYGILIGNREHYPLPGRLFRHGQHFDFMLSWKSVLADQNEIARLAAILNDEIQASRNLEKILFNTHSKGRDKFTSLHRPLILYND